MLQQIIDNTLLKIQEERKDREGSGKISPSSLGFCFRRQLYKLKNIPPSDEIDARTLRVFKAGQLFHDFVQSFIPDNQKEVLVETDYVKGYADIVTEDTVYDIKSQHSRGFWYMTKEGYDVKKEKENNWLQLACYGIFLKKPKICLMVVSKDDLCINEYDQLTKDWYEKVVKELKTIKEWRKKEELPPKEPRLYKGKECKYCNYRTLCKEKNENN